MIVIGYDEDYIYDVIGIEKDNTSIVLKLANSTEVRLDYKTKEKIDMICNYIKEIITTPYKETIYLPSIYNQNFSDLTLWSKSMDGAHISSDYIENYLKEINSNLNKILKFIEGKEK